MEESHCKEALQKAQEEIQQLKEKLHQQAMHDYLTNTYNRRGLQEQCRYLIEVAKRDGSYLSVALLDIDHFDDINRLHGRAKGDEILQILCNIIQDNTRKVDILGRFNGEEFIVLMPNTNKSDAIMVTERIRAYLDTHTLLDTTMSISGGLATISVNISDEAQEGYDKLTLCADEALYHAKKSGRNRILHFDDLN